LRGGKIQSAAGKGAATAPVIQPAPAALVILADAEAERASEGGRVEVSPIQPRGFPTVRFVRKIDLAPASLITGIARPGKALVESLPVGLYRPRREHDIGSQLSESRDHRV